jgi:hypothetical protein
MASMVCGSGGRKRALPSLATALSTAPRPLHLWGRLLSRMPVSVALALAALGWVTVMLAGGAGHTDWDSTDSTVRPAATSVANAAANAVAERPVLLVASVGSVAPVADSGRPAALAGLGGFGGGDGSCSDSDSCGGASSAGSAGWSGAFGDPRNEGMSPSSIGGPVMSKPVDYPGSAASTRATRAARHSGGDLKLLDGNSLGTPRDAARRNGPGAGSGSSAGALSGGAGSEPWAQLIGRISGLAKQLLGMLGGDGSAQGSTPGGGNPTADNPGGSGSSTAAGAEADQAQNPSGGAANGGAPGRVTAGKPAVDAQHSDTPVTARDKANARNKAGGATAQQPAMIDEPEKNATGNGSGPAGRSGSGRSNPVTDSSTQDHHARSTTGHARFLDPGSDSGSGSSATGTGWHPEMTSGGGSGGAGTDGDRAEVMPASSGSLGAGGHTRVGQESPAATGAPDHPPQHSARTAMLTTADLAQNDGVTAWGSKPARGSFAGAVPDGVGDRLDRLTGGHARTHDRLGDGTDQDLAGGAHRSRHDLDSTDSGSGLSPAKLVRQALAQVPGPDSGDGLSGLLGRVMSAVNGGGSGGTSGAPAAREVQVAHRISAAGSGCTRNASPGIATWPTAPPPPRWGTPHR